MQANANENMSRPPGAVVAQGLLYGSFAGAVSGPIVMIGWMYSLEYLYPDTAFMGTGLEVPGSLVVGAILGAIEGPLIGVLWAIRPRRLTLWWLMVSVAVLALLLGLFKIDSVLGLFAITVPIVMAATTRVVALMLPAAQTDNRTRLEPDSPPKSTEPEETESDATSQPMALLEKRATLWQNPREPRREPESRNGHGEARKE